MVDKVPLYNGSKPIRIGKPFRFKNGNITYVLTGIEGITRTRFGIHFVIKYYIKDSPRYKYTRSILIHPDCFFEREEEYDLYI